MNSRPENNPKRYLQAGKVVPNPHAKPSEDHGYPKPQGLVNPPLIECAQCRRLLHPDEFTDLSDPMCTKCRLSVDERELTERRDRDFKSLTKMVTATAGNRKPQLDTIRDVLGELIHNFGGEAIFAQQWHKHLIIAMETRPGSAGLLNIFQGIAKLWMEVDKLQHQENVLDMTDEQLRVKKEIAFATMLTNAASDPGRRKFLIGLMRAKGIDISDVPGIGEEVAHESS